MKKFKRSLLKPFYWFYWLKCRLFDSRPVTFNNWLSKHGFWRLTNWLDNFKVIVPKQYNELIKKYPDRPYISTLKANQQKNIESTFYWYDEKQQNN